MDDNFTKSLIRKHEGLRLKAYRDIYGNWTIGVGCNLERSDISKFFEACGLPSLSVNLLKAGVQQLTEQEADAIFERQYVNACLSSEALIPSWHLLDERAQSVIVDMCFSLGASCLSRFVNMLYALDRLNYHKAAQEIRNSLWALQVPSRAHEDAELMEACVPEVA